MPLSLATEREDDTLVVKVSGEVDMVTSPELDETLRLALTQERPKALVLDTSEVTFLSSAGLAVLVRIHQLAAENTQFRIVAEGATTLRPIELMGLDQELDVYPSLEEAVDDGGRCHT